jgi:hypothetical protein
VPGLRAHAHGIRRRNRDEVEFRVMPDLVHTGWD